MSITLVVASLTLVAQGGPGSGGAGNLAAAVADLQARVAALEAVPPGGGSGLKVLDANDQLIGYWAGGDDFDNVNTMSFINGQWIGLGVDTAGFLSRTSWRVLFSTTDCSGQMYLDSKWSLARRSVVLGAMLYYAADPIAPLAIGSRGTLEARRPVAPVCREGAGRQRRSPGQFTC